MHVILVIIDVLLMGIILWLIAGLGECVRMCIAQKRRAGKGNI